MLSLIIAVLAFSSSCNGKSPYTMSRCKGTKKGEDKYKNLSFVFGGGIVLTSD
jgi:hypothetical protein